MIAVHDNNRDGILRGVDDVPAEYLTDAAVRDAQLARDVTWTNAVSRHLNDPLTNHVRQRTSVDEHASELIDPAMTCIHAFVIARFIITGRVKRRVYSAFGKSSRPLDTDQFRLPYV